jgi:hypothetical protein
MTARICDWSAVDWRKPNELIALETGAAITTVIKRRTTDGHPADHVPWLRLDMAKSNRRPERRRRSAEIQPLATAAAKESPLSGRHAENVHAMEWRLVAPNGTEYKVRNLYEFVRANTDLFSEVDVIWKRTGGKRGMGGEWCNATAGIFNIKGGRAKSWKGWTLK